jgi:hypothetical protein
VSGGGIYSTNRLTCVATPVVVPESVYRRLPASHV